MTGALSCLLGGSKIFGNNALFALQNAEGRRPEYLNLEASCSSIQKAMQKSARDVHKNREGVWFWSFHSK